MPDPTPTTGPRLRFGAGLSGHLNTVQATDDAALQCVEGLEGDRADIAFVFFSGPHVEAASSIVHTIERRLNPSCIIGVSAEATLGGEVELEGAPGISILAASLPGVVVNPFRTDELPMVREGAQGQEDLQGLLERAALGRDHRATFLFCDPFSVPVNHLLPALSRARLIPDRLTAAGIAPTPPQREPADGGVKAGPIMGGMASSSPKPGGNVLILNDRVMTSGGVGLSLSGNVVVDSLVSQGCKPLGPTHVVTAVRGQLVLGLGGKPAIHALTEMLDTLKEPEREMAKKGLFLGRAINEYKTRFGRDDFLIRNVYGVDQTHEAIAVMDLLKVGQTVQFHVRDQATATEDLGLLLDLQQLHGRPAGALLFTCNGRGTKLFDEPHHDARQVMKAFNVMPAGEEAAKMGFPVRASKVPGAERPMAMAGFFAAGEIGPVGDQAFVHGQTACLALFRERDEQAGGRGL
jgi:small ligand-binding sensory domain FIST